ncbi:HTTM domain-containing protein [Streptomyces chattanoogensis]|uniref:HTTM domain-containing protein n=1 Tax=Streptomyces chattanoogensis TaxID=66876 RepID=UPI0036A64CB4
MTAYSPATPSHEPVPSPFAGLRRGFGPALRRGLERVTSGALAPYQSAVLRIGLSLTWLALLLREWGHRNELYGMGSPWSWTMARQLIGTDRTLTVLMWSDSQLWFEIVYAVAIAAAVMLLLGWRTRTASLLFMTGVLALLNRNPHAGNAGEDVIHILAIYLVFTRCGQVWSLDARRSAGGRGGRDVVGIVMWVVCTAVLAPASVLGKLGTGWAVLLWCFAVAQAAWWLVCRYAPGEPRTVMEMVGNVVHAGAMLVIAVQVCLIYSASGWYKIQGSQWQDGTALYYPLHLGVYTPWPAVSHAIASSSVIILILTYGTVMVEVAFAFSIFHRRLRTVMVAIMLSMHAGIGVLLGLPFFSMAMMAADLIFLPTPVLHWAGDRVARVVPRARRGVVHPQAAREQAEPAHYRA